MGLPAIPAPDITPIPGLIERCLAIRAWVDTCDNIDDALEVHRGLAAIEEYLAKRGQEGPAQEAARWLEVRIGDLLGPAVVGRPTNGNVQRDARLHRSNVRDFRRIVRPANGGEEVLRYIRAARAKGYRRAIAMLHEARATRLSVSNMGRCRNGVGEAR